MLRTIKIIETEDGSHSLLHEQLNETYHSKHGALRESEHVFIKHGLNYLIDRQKTSLSVFEVGFGTGLNALLTWQAVQGKEVKIDYTTVEAYPLDEQIWNQLNYPDPKGMLSILHSAAWETKVLISENFNLLKVKTSLQEVALITSQFDLIYFDAFAPNKQPEMWELTMLQKVADTMCAGAVFVTYCAKGQLKRDLKSLGLKVESLPGPPGKREMIRAIKLA